VPQPRLDELHIPQGDPEAFTVDTDEAPRSSGPLAVVIVNFRSAELVAHCVASLPDPPLVPLVVVVDNSPEDREGAERLADLASRDDRVQVHPSARNGGFGAGANAGVAIAQKAGASAVWILNPDVIVRPGCVELLQQTLAAHPGALISPLITSGPAGGEYVWYAGGTVDADTGRVEHCGFRNPLSSAPTELTRVGFLTGTAMLMQLRTFRRLGGFREDLFLYWEDVDLSLRAAANDVPMLVQPAARIWHAQGGSTDQRSDRFYYYAQRNRLIVCWSTAKRSPLSLLVGRGAGETARLIARPVLREERYRMRKLLRSFHGALAGAEAVRHMKRRPRAVDAGATTGATDLG
jgi:GT2 family glycosyltransferase